MLYTNFNIICIYLLVNKLASHSIILPSFYSNLSIVLNKGLYFPFFDINSAYVLLSLILTIKIKFN